MSSNFDINYLHRYVQGDLSAAQMYEVEKAAHQDEMLMDTILGLEEAHQQGHLFPAERLEHKIHKRSMPIRTLAQRRWIPIAAAASLIITLGALSFWLLQDRNDTASIIAEHNPIEHIPQKNKQHLPDSSSKSTDNPLATGSKTSMALAKKKSKDPRPMQPSPAVEDILLAETSSSAQPQRMQQRDTIGINNTGYTSVTIQPSQSPRNAKNSITGAIAMRAAQDSSPTSTFAGRLIDQYTHRPLAGISLWSVADNSRYTTDSLGAFVLASALSNPEIRINAIGYQPTTIALDSEARTIALAPQQPQQLDEIVVRRTTASKSKAAAQPQQGWEAYRTYLAAAAATYNLGHGTVVLRVIISAAGDPQAFTILQSAGDSLDQAAIAIVLKGGKWTAPQKENLITLTLEFKPQNP